MSFFSVRPHGKQSASEVTTLWRFTNMLIIIIIILNPRYQCSRGRFEKIRENEKAGYV